MESLFNNKKGEKMSEEIKDLVEDLGWEYQRMSSCGQETYKKLCLKLGWEFETEEVTN